MEFLIKNIFRNYILIIFAINSSPLFSQKKTYIIQGTYKEMQYNEALNTLGIGVLHRNGKRLHVGSEGHIYKFWAKKYSSFGIGYSPVFELYLLKKNKNRFYIETKGGLIYMLPEYPRTALNFTFFLARSMSSVFQKSSG